MSRTLRILTIVITGIVGLSLISACGSDRFGTFKSRRVTVDEYNEWAKKNGQPLIGEKAPEDKKNKSPRIDSEAAVSPIDPTTPELGKDGPKIKTTTPPATGPKGQVLDGGPPALETDGYDREAWFKYYSGLLVQTPPQVLEFIKGITIESVVENGVTKFQVKANVMLSKPKQDFFMIQSRKDEVKFNAPHRVPTYNFDLKETPNQQGVRDDVGDALFLSATCLKDENPCKTFGVVLAFKVATGSVWAAFQVATLTDLKVNPTGVEKSNLAKLSPYVVPMKVIVDTEEQRAGDVKKIADVMTAAGEVEKLANSAVEAKDQVEAALKAEPQDVDKANEQVKIAEEAAAAAEKITAKRVMPIEANLKTFEDEKMVATLTAKIAKANADVNAAKEAAAAARKLLPKDKPAATPAGDATKPPTGQPPVVVDPDKDALEIERQRIAAETKAKGSQDATAPATAAPTATKPATTQPPVDGTKSAVDPDKDALEIERLRIAAETKAKGKPVGTTTAPAPTAPAPTAPSTPAAPSVPPALPPLKLLDLKANDTNF